MLEQPALTVEQSYRQRYRWVFGILQSLAVLKNFPEIGKLSFWKLKYMIFQVWLRCFLYGAGFVYGLLGTLANLVLLILLITDRIVLQLDPVSVTLLILWAVSFQYGTYWHLKYQLVPWWFKLGEHSLILLAAPILGLLDTAPAIRALWDWYILRKFKKTFRGLATNSQKLKKRECCRILATS